MLRSIRMAVLCSIFGVVNAQEQTLDGPQIYRSHCAICHDSGAERIPSKAELSKLDSERVLAALSSGAMKQQGALLSQEQRNEVARWLGQNAPKNHAATGQTGHCGAMPSKLDNATRRSWTSWGAGIQNWRFQAPGEAALGTQDLSRLRLRWAFGVPETASIRSQPAFYAGRLFFGAGTNLYALDGASGCQEWSTRLSAPIRSGIVVGTPGAKPTLFFGDDAGRVSAVDAATGQLLWQASGDAHPASKITAAPVYDRDRLYVSVASDEEALTAQPGYVCCTFRGSVIGLDARSGKTLWKTYTIDEASSPRKLAKDGGPSAGPSGAAVWSSVTVDAEAGVLYAATGDNYSLPATATSDAVLALSIDTGKILWTKQLRSDDTWNVSCLVPPFFNCPESSGPDFDFGSPPILARSTSGHRLLLLGQKSGAVYALDADRKGEIVWKAQTGKGGNLGGVEWGLAFDGERVFAPVSDLVLRASDPQSPLEADPETGGGLFAFNAQTGKRLWNAAPVRCGMRRPCSPAQTAAVTAIRGAVFSGSMDGHIRAYSAQNGAILWDYDTVRSYQTVNGVAGHGGSLNVAGPVIVNGMLFVVSGYAGFGGALGNVVLSFWAPGS